MSRAMRRLLAPVGLALSSLAHVLSGGCSASSSLAGSGGCDGFCTKWVGAHCRNGPTMDDCMKQCVDEQTRCRPETNAVLKCATIEAQIACETSTGQPRIVGCVPRETSLKNCLACDMFCEWWSQCADGPAREECLATCLDPRCAAEHRAVVDCMMPQKGACETSRCSWSQARACTRAYGQEQPFHWLPVEPLPGDGGADGGADG